MCSSWAESFAYADKALEYGEEIARHHQEARRIVMNDSKLRKECRQIDMNLAECMRATKKWIVSGIISNQTHDLKCSSRWVDIKRLITVDWDHQMLVPAVQQDAFWRNIMISNVSNTQMSFKGFHWWTRQSYRPNCLQPQSETRLFCLFPYIFQLLKYLPPPTTPSCCWSLNAVLKSFWRKQCQIFTIY